MGSRDADRCRGLLDTSRAAWKAGHGSEAWANLAQAEEIAQGDRHLTVEVLARKASLQLVAEMPDDARRTAEECLTLAEDLDPTDPPTSIAVADVRVTLTSLVADQLDAAAVPDALAELEAVARDPCLANTIPAMRAVSNALLLRTRLLEESLHTTTGQVAAWVAVSQAWTATRDWNEHGTLLRQAVDLAFATGHWERGWDYAHQQIHADPERNELVSVLAKAALLAWHRRMLPEARALGARARDASVAVDVPWVRTYAYLGGVITAAAGGGSMTTALRGYAQCTTPEGHASRPWRAWSTAQVALEAGHSLARVERFISQVLPHRDNAPGRLQALMRIQAADIRSADLSTSDIAAAGETTDVPDTVRVHLATARWHRRHARMGKAAQALAEARTLLRNWPGRLLDEVNRELALTFPEVGASPAQRRVLELIADGHSNADIAERLDCSQRTVAVHVSAMLRDNGLSSRTQLATQHLRRQLLGG
jgi:DNA-binding CsgD family transcriptional regulator